MENLTVYNVAVLMNNQEECDYAKELCLKYELHIWQRHDAFDYAGHYTYLFYYAEGNKMIFYVDVLENCDFEDKGLTIITIGEFETLAQEIHSIYSNMDDIIAKLKELNHIINHEKDHSITNCNNVDKL